MSEDVEKYVREIMFRVRTSLNVERGTAPRVSMHLFLASKMNALLSGKSFVTPNEVKEACRMVLGGHNVDLKGREENKATHLLQIISSIPPPI